MANIINYAAVFNRILDEKFYIMPRTMWMENTDPALVYEGGKEIKIPMLETNGLGDMVGYKAPDGDVTFEYETKILQWYRGRNFQIGRYDTSETNFALNVENLLRVFLRSHAVPEMDRVRIATVAQGAINKGLYTSQATASITTSNILGLLLDDIAKVQNEIGEDVQLYIQISTKLKNLLEQSEKIAKYLNVKDFQIRSATLQLNALNDQYLVGTPDAYMKAAVGLADGRTSGQTVGGVIFTALGPGINWIIAAREAVDAISRPQVTKVIDPDTNQEGEFWKVMFSMYHGAWCFDAKAKGTLVNMDTTLGALTVASVAGTVSTGDSIISVTENLGGSDIVKLVWKAASGTAPAVTAGTALTVANGWADLPASGLISTTNGYKLTVAAVAKDSLLPLSYGTADVVAKT